MKASAILPVLLLFAVSCSDTPTAPSGIASPTSISGGFAGNPPPPPADVSVVLCSPGGCGEFDGTYFSNGADATLAAAITQQLDVGCAYPEATSWLKFGNHQSVVSLLDATASSNAQIRCHNGKLAGTGRVEYQLGDDQIVIAFRDVLSFENTPDCSVELPFCASFTATVTRDGVDAGIARGTAINREFYEANCQLTEGGYRCDDGEGDEEVIE